MRYGGNTSCVALEVPGQPPILLDLGTGLRFFGLNQPQDGSFKGYALVSHMHWDHVQGLPFFTPIHQPGAQLDVYVPPQEDGLSVMEAVERFLSPPLFPISVRDFGGAIGFHLAGGTFQLGEATITAADVPHIGPTHGYRIDWNGVSVAYVSDHQQPADGSDEVSEAVIELCRDVDLLIHDAQFDDLEFAQRAHWGHCTVDYAVHVAARAGAKTLALFHHDPSHSDERIDALLDGARALAERLGVGEVIAAHEGLTVSYLPVS